jgi:hypothetical protein
LRPRRLMPSVIGSLSNWPVDNTAQSETAVVCILAGYARTAPSALRESDHAAVQTVCRLGGPNSRFSQRSRVGAPGSDRIAGSVKV